MNEFDRVGALAMRHLVAFETVAEERSFTRAARRLGYTQSAVSHQMATLERLVGKQLIERPRGTEAAHLTEAGEVLHRHAQALISRVKLAYDDLDGLAEGVGGTFRFGTYQSMSTSILPHVLRRFSEQFPLVRVHLTESVDDLSLVRDLEDGKLDASFVTLPLPEVLPHRRGDPARRLRAAGRARLALRGQGDGAEPRGDRTAAADRVALVARRRGHDARARLRAERDHALRRQRHRALARRAPAWEPRSCPG